MQWAIVLGVLLGGECAIVAGEHQRLRRQLGYEDLPDGDDVELLTKLVDEALSETKDSLTRLLPNAEGKSGSARGADASLEIALRFPVDKRKTVPLATAPELRVKITFRVVDDALLDVSVKILPKEAATKVGWVGFGLSYTGSIRGTDLFIARSEAGGKGGDYHVVDVATGFEPDAQQDWRILDSGVGFGRAQRRLVSTDTCNDRDVPLRGTQAHIVVAAGIGDPADLPKSATAALSGPARWGARDVDLHATAAELEAAARPPQGGHQDLLMDVDVPATERTTVFCKAFRVDQRFGAIIGIVPLIRAKEDLPIHHLHVHWCSDNAYFSSFEKVRECEEYPPSFDPDLSKTGCVGQIFTFTSGGTPLLMPPGVGLPIGTGSAGVEVGYIILEAHYDNVDLIEGRRDMSGMRLLLAKEPPMNHKTVGFMQFADPFASCPVPIPIGVKDYEVMAQCPGSCTATWSHPIHVFASLHHMHLTGQTMRTTIVRGGKGSGGYSGDRGANPTSRVEYFEHEFQHFKPDFFTVYPGDTVQTQCTFTHPGAEGGFPGPIMMGPSTAEEMCMHAFLYYPKMDFMLCGAGMPEPLPKDEARYKGALDGIEDAPYWCGAPRPEKLLPAPDTDVPGEGGACKAKAHSKLLPEWGQKSCTVWVDA